MPGQIIGTVNVQVGQPSNPKVPSINYGGRTLKSATDLSLAGVQNNYVIAYKASTDSFIMSDLTSTITRFDAGFF